MARLGSGYDSFMASEEADRAPRGPGKSLRDVAIGAILIGYDRRPVRDVTDLAASIMDVGLLAPIIVTPALRLVAGLHRLTACRKLGWTTIPALVLDVDEIREQLVELDENFARTELTELERALALRKRKTLYLALHPGTRPVTERGGPGRGKRRSTEASVLAFANDAAQQFGVSARTIRRSIQIAERLDSAAADLLRDTPIANSRTDLVRFAGMQPALQRQVADLLANGSGTVKNALRQLRWRAIPGAERAPRQGQHYALLTGDFAAESARLPAEGVDLIFADVPWSQAFTPRLVEVAQVSARVLRPGGRALVVIGQEFLPDAFRAFGNDDLTYRWTLCLRSQRPKQSWRGAVLCAWLPVLVFQRGRDERRRDVRWDVLDDTDGATKADPWEKGEKVLLELVDRYSHPGDQILDLFCGGGSMGTAAVRLGRRFTGIDIDPAATRLAASRIVRATWADPQLAPHGAGRAAYPV